MNVEVIANQNSLKNKERGNESMASGHFKQSECPKTGGSILSLLEEVVKVGQRYGSDYFVIIRGTWRTSGQKVLMIAVYGPHDCRDKQSLWEFLHHEISKWRGEVIIMGDFNEFGRKSHLVGAILLGFLNRLRNEQLIRFPLVSENLLVSCPHLTAVTLERYLSDHRPILLREKPYDYGPTPFRFFHHWIQTDGFDKIVSESWKNSPSGGTNAMKSLMYKLKHLKYDIREWNKHNMVSRKNMKTQYKKNLEAVDQILDSGQGVERNFGAFGDFRSFKMRRDRYRWNWLKSENPNGY
ncbi:RNA-directed DNA polymerase, eukaryota [Tanacetum coccineum]